jgi:hypothetical protein
MNNKVIETKLREGLFLEQFLDAEKAEAYKKANSISLSRGCGVELELITTFYSKEALLSYLRKNGIVTGYNFKGWNVKSDGSLRSDLPPDWKYDSPSNRVTAEIVSPIMFNDSFLQIKKVCKLLQNIDILQNVPVAFVNRSCGLHVHISVEHNTEEERKSIYYTYLSIRDTLYKVVADYRLTTEWAIKTTNSYEDRLRSSIRYTDINTYTSNYNTFEYRISQPTLDSDKIISWALLLQAIHEYGENHIIKQVESLNLYNVLQFPILWNYYNEQCFLEHYSQRSKIINFKTLNLETWNTP